MKAVLTAIIVPFLCGGLATVAPQARQSRGQPAAGATAITASAAIAGKGISGTATFREVDAKSAGAADPNPTTSTRLVEVAVKVSGLAPGPHGVHLHAVGRCEAPEFTTAGGHFDPGPHGDTEPDANHPFHMGDLPNIVADASGNAAYTATTSRVRLAEGPLSVFDADGSAIVIHADPDQGISGPPKSGVSGGARVACGVLERR